MFLNDVLFSVNIVWILQMHVSWFEVERAPISVQAVWFLQDVVDRFIPTGWLVNVKTFHRNRIIKDENDPLTKVIM